MIRKSVFAMLLAGMLAMLSIGTAFAHECVISSRSDRGDQGATNSKVWETLPLERVLSEFIGLPQPIVDAALELRAEYDIPESWVYRGDKTIGAGSSNPNLANFKGLDHLATMMAPQLDALIGAAIEQVEGGS